MSAIVTYPDTENRHADSQKLTTDKILQATNGGGSGGGGGAPTDATYITQTPNATLTSEQALSALSTGILKVATGTGIITTASEGTDYAGAYFNKVGTAYIGGDQTGNARGANALDVQSARSAVTQVASGQFGFAFGANNTASASGAYSSAAFGFGNVASGAGSAVFGRTNTASNYYGVAIGFSNTVAGQEAAGIGSSNTASGTSAVAIGKANVASGVGGNGSTAIGFSNEATGHESFAIGKNNTSSAYGAGTLGRECAASASTSFAFGASCTASATSTLALGFTARARIVNTVNICGPQIIRKHDTGESQVNAFFQQCGVEVVLCSIEVDLESVADQTITLPAGCHFFPNEVGVWVTSLSGLVTQPTVRFGWTGTPAGLIAAAVTTALTATFKRERYTSLLDFAGQTSLVAGVTSAASATTLLGRFYWKGMLVEDE